MPSGPAELHERWGGDAAALQHLHDRGYGETPSGLLVPPRDHEASDDDNSALNYLFLEWDYGVMEDAIAIEAFWLDRGL